MKFSANLGFLWTELPLPAAIAAAAAAGFDAVECHWPYEVPAAEVRAALAAAGLEMLGLNTRRGDVAAGENGLAALPGREDEARAAIREAVAYAAAIGARTVHVMAGKARGAAAEAVFIENLRYACGLGREAGVGILIEPLNHYDAPGYFLGTTQQAEAVIAAVGADNLRLMFDCYHVQLMEGDVVNRLKRLMPVIGHIQFAAVPDRGAPDHGELNYPWLFRQIAAMGYDAPLGAEYKPGGDSGASLGWLAAARGARG